MSYYFWLGADAEQYRKLVSLKVVNSPNYPDPPYDYEAKYEDE
jgi:hypothetical protein